MLTFDPIKHEYRWDGVKVPAVTDCLNLLFGTFYGSDPEPARHGTMIHDLCQKYLISFDRNLSTEPEFLQFVKWCDDEEITPFEPIETEERFYCEAHGYAGTRDSRFIDRNWVVDFKTGQEQKGRDSMQLNAYKFPLHQGYSMCNLYLPKEGNYRFVVRNFSREQFRVFLCALEVLKFNKNF